MKISGHLLTIGDKNLNGWGLPENESQRLLFSLIGLPLKICPGIKDHTCDYTPTPNSIIGKVLSASREKGGVNIIAEVSDIVAAHRIRTGKYPKAWSIFSGYRSKDANNMLIGAQPQSVTIVEQPAYPGAGFSILPDPEIAAALAGMSNSQVAAAIGRLERNYQRQEQKFSPLEEYYLHPIPPAQNSISPAEKLAKSLWKLQHKYQGK